ncbi:UpxY family transcription antiterminator [Phocaeicola dorei]|nr:UpxY family transcription antiterminator [Phocaeicola dorei]
MRDLKRTNAKLPAYKLLDGEKMEVFVPMKWHLVTRKGVRAREEVPFIQDLLFVHETRRKLDAVVEKTPTLQYRWLRNTWREPMVVADADMERFIRAVNATEFPRYYLPEEITPAMYGRNIRIVGGTLNGYQGSLLTTRGSKVKRLLVELKGFLAVGVEVNPEYIQLI